MKASPLVLGCLVALGAPVAACGGSDKARRISEEEAGVAGGGAGGRPGNSGTAGRGSGGTPNSGSGGASTGGAPSAGGVAGAPVEAGPPDAAPEASLPDAAPEAEAGLPDLVCPDAGAPVEAGGAGDAGDAAVGYWRDLAARVCRPCPAPQVICSDLLAGAAPTYDPATRLLTVSVPQGLTEVVSASFEADYSYTSEGGFFSAPTTAQATVDRNVLRVDLSADVPANAEMIEGFFTVTDACGQTGRTNPGTDELRVTLTPLDGGTTSVVTDCHVTD